MDTDTGKLFIEFIGMQQKLTETMLQIASELRALRLTVSSLDPRAEAVFQRALPTVQNTFAEAIRQQQAALELLKATVSGPVQ